MFSSPVKTHRAFSNKLVWIELIMVLTSLTLLAYLAAFLYRDFYETVVQAEAVLVLKKEVSLKNIELEKYQRAEQVEKKKHENGLPAAAPDIFAALP